MAVEDRIDASDEWFVGEDRQFRFRMVEGETDDIADWAVVMQLFPRRSSNNAVPLLEVSGIGIPGSGSVLPSVVTVISAEQSLQLGPGIFQYVLRRTDPGLRQILSYGPAELRSAVNA